MPISSLPPRGQAGVIWYEYQKVYPPAPKIQGAAGFSPNWRWLGARFLPHYSYSPKILDIPIFIIHHAGVVYFIE
jgi:hypothetical protein